jgi:hypothetical protein
MIEGILAAGTGQCGNAPAVGTVHGGLFDLPCGATGRWRAGTRVLTILVAKSGA